MLKIKTCLIAALGLHEHELRLIKSILKHGNDKTPGRFEWAESTGDAHLILVSEENETAMREWEGISTRQPAPVLLLITPGLDSVLPGYHLSRPFSPSKVLAMLEKIILEKLSLLLEGSLFEGGDDTLTRSKVLALGKAAEQCNVLVVDDSPTVRKQLEIELGSYGIRVDVCETGEECLEQVVKGNYDIIFLDVVLPGIDGYEVCRKIRKNNDTKRTPVIMLTSKSSSFDKVRGAMAGCNSYLTKPVDYVKFHKVLEEYLA